MVKYDNCKNCVSHCEHAGKDREFICPGGKSCKVLYTPERVAKAAVKGITVARYSIPETGRRFSGCMDIGFHLMNVSEWGFNYELHFQNNGNNERIQ